MKTENNRIPASTATGLRLGARSPPFDRNGTLNKATINTAGNTRMINVSAQAGLNDRRPNNHRNGHSGRGLAPPSGGSGGAVGPFGPASAARTTTMTTTSAEKNRSFRIAAPKKGTPDVSPRCYSPT